MTAAAINYSENALVERPSIAFFGELGWHTMGIGGVRNRLRMKSNGKNGP